MSAKPRFESGEVFCIYLGMVVTGFALGLLIVGLVFS